MKTLAKLVLAVLAVMVLIGPINTAYAQQPMLSVVYEVGLDQHYGLYSGTTQNLKLTISGDIPQTKNVTVVAVDFQFQFRSVLNLPAGAGYNLSVIEAHPLVSAIDVYLPPGTNAFSFSVLGTSQDASVFYRNTATITDAFVSMNSPPYDPTSYKILIPLTSHFDIASVFPGTGPGLVTQQVLINGTNYLQTGFSLKQNPITTAFPTTIVIYQPAFFNYLLIAYLALTVAVIAVVGTFLRVGPQGTRKALLSITGLFVRFARSINSRKLLAALVAVGFIMVGFSFVFGPNPTPRVYLAAKPDTAATVLGPAVTAAGYSYLTPVQAADEFDSLSSFGSFYSIVVADYPIPLPSAGLSASYRIIAMGQYLPPSYVQQLRTQFGVWVTVDNTTQQLTKTLLAQKLNYEPNHLGLPVPNSVYSVVASLVGLLSLVVPFLALAFFARYMVESMSAGLGRLAQAVAFAFFIFLFGELIYIQTAVLLGIPVALHATISSQETAIGVFGLGGGSRPRLVMGFFGFLFGALVGSGRTIKFDRPILAGLLAAVVFLVADPLQLGQNFYNLILLAFTSESGTAFGQSTYVGVRAFISYFMNAFGNFITSAYYSQHGAVIFFVGAVPFALYTYVRKSSATLLLFFSAALAGLGYVRIGDQDPLKAIASTAPGLTLALVFIVFFLSLDQVERFLRFRFGFT